MCNKIALKHRFNYYLINNKYNFISNIILNIIQNAFMIIIIVFFKLNKKNEKYCFFFI